MKSLIICLQVAKCVQGFRSKLNVLFIIIQTILFKIRIISEKKEFELEFGNKRENFYLFVSSISELATLHETFFKEEYDISCDTNIRIILDLGSNIGDTIVYFLLKYPNAIIYSVEASESLFKKLQKSFKDNPRVKLIFGAVSKGSKFIDFFINETNFANSIYNRNGSVKKVRVPAFSIQDIINSHCLESVDLLKFDIEGAEYDLFRDDTGFLSKVRNLIGEVHPDITGESGDIITDSLKDFNILKISTSRERFIIKGSKKIF